jgi:hypothetical protein
MFDPDLFIAWMAERGEGTIAALTDKLCWAGDVDDKAARRWINLLQPMGKADIDWGSQKWRARAAAVAPLPGSGAVAVVIGAAVFDQNLMKGLGGITRRFPSSNQLALPSTTWLRYDDNISLEHTAAELGMRVIGCRAEELAADLQRADAGKTAPAPPRPIQQLNPYSAQFVSFKSAVALDGAYRHEEFGRRWRYYVVKDGVWRRIERPEAFYLGAGPDVVWQPERTGAIGPYPDRLGTLKIAVSAPLPVDRAETAVMCTGLPPVRCDDLQVYDGVPCRIAERIAWSLGQKLTIRESGRTR